jgi:kumamolisin
VIRRTVVVAGAVLAAAIIGRTATTAPGVAKPQLGIRSVPAGGVTATDIFDFYDIRPLRRSGLTGAGQTIVFPEIDGPVDRTDLAKFASTNHLPSFRLDVHASWGPPLKGNGEVMMDLEIAHLLAPGAKLIVYQSAANFSDVAAAEKVMVKENPGAIISESIGACERELSALARKNLATLNTAAARAGMTHYVASGDHGAYGCAIDDPTISADFPSVLPTVTSVGGTSIFERAKPGYYREVVWSGAIEGWGGGGGISAYYSRPSWQTGPGVPVGRQRLVPDVAALGDADTGWHLYFGHKDRESAGTSAGAPFWAAITALIDERLQRRGLRRVGQANDALYWIGRNQSRFKRRPFHDITQGQNFRYHAHPGWDIATGWGSPDVAALAAAWETYLRTHKR